MAQALVRNVSDELLEAYRRAARANGRSLQAELRAALERAKPTTQPDVQELKQLSERLRAMTPNEPPQGDSTQIIRWYRDTHGGRWTDDGWADAAHS